MYFQETKGAHKAKSSRSHISFNLIEEEQDYDNYSALISKYIMPNLINNSSTCNRWQMDVGRPPSGSLRENNLGREDEQRLGGDCICRGDNLTPSILESFFGPGASLLPSEC